MARRIAGEEEEETRMEGATKMEAAIGPRKTLRLTTKRMNTLLLPLGMLLPRMTMYLLLTLMSLQLLTTTLLLATLSLRITIRLHQFRHLIRALLRAAIQLHLERLTLHLIDLIRADQVNMPLPT
jgi:hypothetical protein